MHDKPKVLQPSLDIVAYNAACQTGAADFWSNWSAAAEATAARTQSKHAHWHATYCVLIFSIINESY
jgi:hypothetical protein